MTLAKAFRLCGLKDGDLVYLRPISSNTDYCFTGRQLRETCDMKKIHVVNIRPRFEHFGPDYLGMCFTIRGADIETLTRKCFKF